MAGLGTTTIAVSLDEVTRCLASRISLYRWRRPVYQAALLRSLGRVWNPGHKRVLDVGGGTGIVAQAVKDLFPVDRVVSIDVEDRYLAQLDIETRTYDGKTLPGYTEDSVKELQRDASREGMEGI